MTASPIRAMPRRAARPSWLWGLGLGVALCAPPALADDLEFSNLQGSLLHNLFVESDGDTGWIAEGGGLVRHSTDGFQTWTFQETPVRSQLIDVHFIEGGTYDGYGWAVGEEHSVLYTQNGGSTWAQVSPGLLPDHPEDPTDTGLWGVFFLEVDSELHGWVVGREGALWYCDDGESSGGATWVSQAQNVSPAPWHGYQNEDRYGVVAVEDGEGTLHTYVTGDWGVILHSTDEGAEWELLDVEGQSPSGLSDPNIEIYDIEVQADGEGHAVGGVQGGSGGNGCGRVYRITDWTTVTWEALGEDNPAPDPVPSSCSPDPIDAGAKLYGVSIAEDGRAIGGGYAGHCWRSTLTTGADWESLFVELPSADPIFPPLYGLDVVGEEAWQVGHGGAIRYCADVLDDVSAPVWVNRHGTESTRLYCGDFVSTTLGFTAGQGMKVFKTSDGGASMTEVFSLSSNSYNARALDFADADHGMVVGEATAAGLPFVAYTHAGGDSSEWTVATSGLTSLSPVPDLLDVQVWDEDLAWACGTAGYLFETTDGGASWSELDLGTAWGDATVHAVEFVSTSVGLVCGAGGKLAVTTDGGDTWSLSPVKLDSSTTYTGALLDLAVRAPSTVVAAGENGQVFVFDPMSSPPALLADPNLDLDVAIQCIELHPTASEIYAGAVDGSFHWFDGSSWSEPNSRVSTEVVDIAPIGDDGFLVARGALNRFDAVP